MSASRLELLATLPVRLFPASTSSSVEAAGGGRLRPVALARSPPAGQPRSTRSSATFMTAGPADGRGRSRPRPARRRSWPGSPTDLVARMKDEVPPPSDGDLRERAAARSWRPWTSSWPPRRSARKRASRSPSRWRSSGQPIDLGGRPLLPPARLHRPGRPTRRGHLPDPGLQDGQSRAAYEDLVEFGRGRTHPARPLCRGPREDAGRPCPERAGSARHRGAAIFFPSRRGEGTGDHGPGFRPGQAAVGCSATSSRLLEKGYFIAGPEAKCEYCDYAPVCSAGAPQADRPEEGGQPRGLRGLRQARRVQMMSAQEETPPDQSRPRQDRRRPRHDVPGRGRGRLGQDHEPGRPDDRPARVGPGGHRHPGRRHLHPQGGGRAPRAVPGRPGTGAARGEGRGRSESPARRRPDRPREVLHRDDPLLLRPAPPGAPRRSRHRSRLPRARGARGPRPARGGAGTSTRPRPGSRTKRPCAGSTRPGSSRPTSRSAFRGAGRLPRGRAGPRRGPSRPTSRPARRGPGEAPRPGPTSSCPQERPEKGRDALQSVLVRSFRRRRNIGFADGRRLMETIELFDKKLGRHQEPLGAAKDGRGSACWPTRGTASGTTHVRPGAPGVARVPAYQGPGLPRPGRRLLRRRGGGPRAGSTSRTSSCSPPALLRDNPEVRRYFRQRFHPILRRRVPGHRPHPGRDPVLPLGQHGRRRSATGPRRTGRRSARARVALPGRRSQAVDLPVPAGRHRHLQPGQGPHRGVRRRGRSSSAPTTGRSVPIADWVNPLFDPGRGRALPAARGRLPGRLHAASTPMREPGPAAAHGGPQGHRAGRAAARQGAHRRLRLAPRGRVHRLGPGREPHARGRRRPARGRPSRAISWSSSATRTA
ncbi:MAG: hypothetical protein M0C28_07100 [Candidatus Moduliflexus flocculans]|nr:hypothetical protein [Candidatus Moduliflexus flocculans]